jgi:hypothetical protein
VKICSGTFNNLKADHAPSTSVERIVEGKYRPAQEFTGSCGTWQVVRIALSSAAAQSKPNAMLLSRENVQADFHAADFSLRVHEVKNRQKAVIFYPAAV